MLDNRLHTIGWIGLVGVALAASGCADTRDTHEYSTFVKGEDAARAWPVDAQTKAGLRAGFATYAEGHGVVTRPAPAPHDRRWSDMELAVAYACDEVEMAVVRVFPLKAEEIQSLGSTGTEGFRFVVTSIDDQPGELIVIRREPPQIYEATATVGIFGDRTDEAEALIDALDEQLLAFGRKRKWGE